MSSVTSILKDVLGESEKYEEIVDLFTKKDIDGEAFYSLDKETLVELGMHLFYYFSSYVYFCVIHVCYILFSIIGGFIYIKLTIMLHGLPVFPFSK